MDKQLWAAVITLILTAVTIYFLQRRDIDKLETNLNRRIDDLRSEVKAEIAAVRSEMTALRSEMNARFADFLELLRSEVGRRH